MSHKTFRSLVESRDLEGLKDIFEENAVLQSPVSFKPFLGRKAIGELLAILMEVFEDFHYVDELDSDSGAKALIFEASVKGRQLQGLDLLRFSPNNLVQELTVMVRPRSALETLLQEVGSRLARK